MMKQEIRLEMFRKPAFKPEYIDIYALTVQTS